MPKLELIRLLLRHHAQDEHDWGIGYRPLMQWLYTIKAIICVILGLNKRSDYLLNSVWPIATWGFVSGVSYEYSPSASWEGLAVGHGWRNWWYHIYNDGYP